MRCHAIFPSHPYENQNRDIGVNHSIAHAVANFIVLYWVHKNDELRIYTCIISFFPCGQSSALLRVKKKNYIFKCARTHRRGLFCDVFILARNPLSPVRKMLPHGLCVCVWWILKYDSFVEDYFTFSNLCARDCPVDK